MVLETDSFFLKMRWHPRQAAPYLRTQQMWKQYNRSCVNCSVSSTTGRGSLSATNEKNAEANTKAFNQKTMQAPGHFGRGKEIFEETVDKVTLETEEGDMLFAVAYQVGRARQRPRETKTVCRTLRRRHSSRFEEASLSCTSRLQ